jgi:hypothetical protein
VFKLTSIKPGRPNTDLPPAALGMKSLCCNYFHTIPQVAFNLLGRPSVRLGSKLFAYGTGLQALWQISTVRDNATDSCREQPFALSNATAATTDGTFGRAPSGLSATRRMVTFLDVVRLLVP